MDITIRKMRPGDADALYRLLSAPAVMRYLARDWQSRRLCMPPRRTEISSAM